MKFAILFASVALAACSGSSSTEPPAPAEVDLTASGATAGGNPTVNISIPSGGKINFVNKDTASHQIASSDCSELNSPQLAQNQTFLATMVGGPKSCTFHDALNPAASPFTGNIAVTAPGTDGGGY